MVKREFGSRKRTARGISCRGPEPKKRKGKKKQEDEREEAEDIEQASKREGWRRGKGSQARVKSQRRDKKRSRVKGQAFSFQPIQSNTIGDEQTVQENLDVRKSRPDGDKADRSWGAGGVISG